MLRTLYLERDSIVMVSWEKVDAAGSIGDEDV